MKKMLKAMAVVAAIVIIFRITVCSYNGDYVLDGFVLVEGTTICPKVFIEGRSVIIKDFYICDHEVTQAEYEKYCSYYSIPYTPSSTYGVGDNYPVYYVSWYDALVYCNRRSIAEGLAPCYTMNYSTNPDEWGDIPSSSNSAWDTIECNFSADGYRLPTEAEWGYAARGGSQSQGHTYSGSNTLDDVAWYDSNSDCTSHEVKGKTANELGLYDMSGNVFEWCYDWYSSVPSSTRNTGAISGSYRVIRGGSWNNNASNASVSYRNGGSPYYRYYFLGFRVVRSIKKRLI